MKIFLKSNCPEMASVTQNDPADTGGIVSTQV